MSRSSATAFLLLTAACVLQFPLTRVRAWGDDGHRIVGLIAEQRLTRATRAKLDSLLGPRAHLYDYDVGSWADYVRSDRPETRPWHYVNIPFEAATYDRFRDCPNEDCLVAQLEVLSRRIADPTRSQVERSEAIRFFVHLVADLHQPLHCIERTNALGRGDRGGNLRVVYYPGQGVPVNLHSVWDTALVVEAEGVEEVLTYADRLSRGIAKKDEDNWRQGAIVKWAEESHDIAVASTYNGVPADGDAPTLSKEYCARSVRIVSIQLSRAGVRLATLLNRVLE